MNNNIEKILVLESVKITDSMSLEKVAFINDDDEKPDYSFFRVAMNCNESGCQYLYDTTGYGLVDTDQLISFLLRNK